MKNYLACRMMFGVPFWMLVSQLVVLCVGILSLEPSGAVPRIGPTRGSVDKPPGSEVEDCRQILVPVAASRVTKTLSQAWLKAQSRVPELRRLLIEDRVLGAYGQTIFSAVEASVGKHQRFMVRGHRQHQLLDLARHLGVLATIENFDSTRPQWSAYKIKRAIEGRHSLYEYIHCRESESRE